MAESGLNFWKRVDNLRGRMSIRELAVKTGLPESSLQSTRSTKSLPKIQMMYPIAKALGTTVEYLYAGERLEFDDEDSELFRRIAASQDYVDICHGLLEATPEDIILVKRVLRVERGYISSTRESGIA